MRQADKMKMIPKPHLQFNSSLEDGLRALLEIGLTITAAFLLGSWTWAIILPAPKPIPPKLELQKDEVTSSIISNHWFEARGTGNINLGNTDFKLVGVFSSSSNKDSFAIIRTADNKQRAVLAHEDITPGIKLLVIGKDFIEIGNQNSSRRVQIENPSPLSKENNPKK